MDPFTMMMLMSAGGGFMNAMNRASTPQNALAGQPMLNNSAYQPYYNTVLANGFNPQSQLYANTSQVANNAMKTNLAQKGVLNSSAGDQALTGLNTSLANSQIQNQMQREQQAMQTVGNFQNSLYGTNIALGGANNQQGWNTFGGNTMNNQMLNGGIMQGLGGISGAYGAYMNNQNNQNMNNLTSQQYQQYMNDAQNQSNYMMNSNGTGGSGMLGFNPQW